MAQTQKQDRGSGAEKIELEKRLDANAVKERKASDNAKAANDGIQPEDRSEEQIDEALDESFPASDPPAHSVPTRGLGK